MRPLTLVDPENGSRLVDRIRWGNVGRAALVAAAVALVLLWPRLGARPPELPAAAAVPAARAPGEVGPPKAPGAAVDPAPSPPSEFGFERGARHRPVARMKGRGSRRRARPRAHRKGQTRGARRGHRGGGHARRRRGIAVAAPQRGGRRAPADPVEDEFGVG